MCTIKAIVLLAFMALTLQTSLSICPGCADTGNPNNIEVRETLEQVLLTQNSDDKITKIISVTKQIVAGVMYRVKFETENRQSNDKRICQTGYLLQPWLSKVPQVQFYSCKDKR